MTDDIIKEAIKEEMQEEIKRLPFTLSSEEVQEKLNIGRTTTQRLLREGKIPNKKIANKYRIGRMDFIKYLYEKERE